MLKDKRFLWKRMYISLVSRFVIFSCDKEFILLKSNRYVIAQKVKNTITTNSCRHTLFYNKSGMVFRFLTSTKSILNWPQTGQLHNNDHIEFVLFHFWNISRFFPPPNRSGAIMRFGWLSMAILHLFEHLH